ncbi:MAG: alpha/beta hydrolase [Myxococcota bacterium]
MPSFHDTSRDVVLHYQITGSPDAFPVLLLAPGGMTSTIQAWQRGWIDPHGYLDRVRLIAMDQRNAGASKGPIEPDHDWSTYLADQLALVDHLNLPRFAVLGMCIGGPYGLALCRARAEQVAAAVLFQPLGKSENQDALDQRFDAWRSEIEADHPEADEDRWQRFRAAMFGGTFVFTVTPDEAAAIRTPVLLFAGNDSFHPLDVSELLAEQLPHVTFVREWKAPHHADAVQTQVREFLATHR